MTTSSKFSVLQPWLIYSKTPNARGSFIKGLKDNAPDNIRKLYDEYISHITNRE